MSATDWADSTDSAGELDGSYAWELVDTGADCRFRALSVIDSRCVWLAGLDGSVRRSTDGGSTWSTAWPTGGADAELRAITAFDELTALAMSAGPGESAGLYLTEDGGAGWSRVFGAADPSWYLDGMAFVDRRTGVVIGDPIDGRFTVLRTTDGGRSWEHVPADLAPEALPGEGAFAASGSCAVAAHGALWFGTGGGAAARVLRSDDGGRSWSAHETGLRSGPMAGVFGLRFADARHGFAVGGDHSDQHGASPALARTASGGAEWSVVSGSGPRGYRSAVACLPGAPQTVIAVGPHIGDISHDGGTTWAPLAGAFDAVGTAPDGSCWAAGEAGRVARLVRRIAPDPTGSEAA